MKSITTPQFRQMFADLPTQIQDRTCRAYRQFQQDPNYPSLRFKKVHPKLPIYSDRDARSTDFDRANPITFRSSMQFQRVMSFII